MSFFAFTAVTEAIVEALRWAGTGTRWAGLLALRSGLIALRRQQDGQTYTDLGQRQDIR